MSSHTHGTPLSVQCSFCGNKTTTQENLTTNPNGDPFCNECIMDIDCGMCGKDIILTKKQVAEHGNSGGYVCQNCENQLESEDSTGAFGWLDTYLSIAIVLFIIIFVLNSISGGSLSDAQMRFLIKGGAFLLAGGYVFMKALK